MFPKPPIWSIYLLSRITFELRKFREMVYAGQDFPDERLARGHVLKARACPLRGLYLVSSILTETLWGKKGQAVRGRSVRNFS